MKKHVHLVVVTSLIFCQTLSAKVIYGDDNRVEVFEASAFQQNLAHSTASMISQNDITFSGDTVKLTQRTLKEWLEASLNEPDKNKMLLSPSVLKAKDVGVTTFCDGERFVDQPNPSMCSGFLIAPDLIVTAGHCAELPTFCSEYRWVFDFKEDPVTKTAGLSLKEENVYKCKRVVSNILSMPLGLDYAVVQLDRRVTDREPLEIRSNSMIEDNSPLFVVGSPSGLPLKVSGGANVRENTHPFYFRANLDTFQGNSGSPVFNAITGAVEGILVRGEDDFVPNQEKMCIQTKKCANGECRGEDVSRMTSIPEIGIQEALNDAAFKGDLVNLQKLLKLNTWVDFYLKDGQTALMKAVQGAQLDAVKMILSRSADINLQDSEGNSSLHHVAKITTVQGMNVLSELLSSGADIEKKNNTGETPLLVAGNSLNLKASILLIQARANPNALDASGETVLFSFARAGNESAVKELMKLGVDETIKNKEGFSVADLARGNKKSFLAKLFHK